MSQDTLFHNCPVPEILTFYSLTVSIFQYLWEPISGQIVGAINALNIKFEVGIDLNHESNLQVVL